MEAIPMRKYIYAIIDAVEEKAYELKGLNDAGVHTISNGSIAAVVSDLSDKRVRPERKNLAAHNAIIKQFMNQESALLPVAFGTLARNRKAVFDTLEKNRATLIPHLDEVRGKVEMGLHVTLDVPNIFEYMLNSQPELAAMRDRVYGKQHGPSQMDQIELGSLFDRLLNKDRERYTAAVMQALEPYCSDIKQNPPREGEVVHLACLVERDAMGKFESAIFEAANLFDNNFSFDFNGPWAAHNFVEVHLDTEDVDD